MPDFSELFNSEHAKKLMNNQNTVSQLKNAPESQRLIELLGQQADGNLEDMANAAVKGNPQQLMDAIQKLLHDPESKKLLDEISQNLKL